MYTIPFCFLSFQLCFIAAFTTMFHFMGWWAVPVICVAGAVASSVLLHALIKWTNSAR